MRIAPTLTLSPEQRAALEQWSRSRSLPARVVERARLVLSIAEGQQDKEVAAVMKITPKKVARWRKRFLTLGAAGLCDFLERWPSLEELQKAPCSELKKFFRHRRGRQGELTEWRMQGISQAMPAIGDRAVIEAKRTVVQVIAQLLRTLLEGIATLDRKIAEADNG